MAVESAARTTSTPKPSLTLKGIFELLRDTVGDWQKDNAPRLSAALTYYAIFSMAPVFIIALAVAGLILGPKAARGELYAQVESFVGSAGAQVIQGLIDNAAHPGASIIATIISIITIVLASSGLFAELQAALNLIWDIHTPPPKGFLGGILLVVKDRLLAFALVVGAGVLLLVTFALGIAAGAFSNALQSIWAAGTPYVLQGITFLVTFVLMAAVFAVIFRVLPDASITWGDVWFGAFFTSFLFNIGRLLIGLYLSNTTIGSAYGAAGSLIALLIWVNYSAQIFYLGAEFTQVYARRRGSHFGTRPTTQTLPNS